MREQESVAHVPVSNATLESIGAERLFQLYVDRIAECMVDQGEGRRAVGDIVFTLKVSIGKREEGVRYHGVGHLKEPPYTGTAVVGHMAPVGDGKVALRVINPGPQTAFVFSAHRRDDDDEQGLQPHDS